MKLLKKSTKLLIFMIVFAIIFSLTGCGARVDMPFNGEVVFHDISLTIPTDFIRDSTESTEDFWVFEKGFYDQIILLSRSNVLEDTSIFLDSYVNTMEERGATAAQTTFLECSAVLSTYTLDGVYCQEMLFAYQGSYYAVALRGGNDKEFLELLNTVTL